MAETPDSESTLFTCFESYLFYLNRGVKSFLMLIVPWFTIV